MSEAILIGAALLHALMLFAALAAARAARRRLGLGRALFAALLPAFGPLILLLFARARKPTQEDAEWMRRNENRHEVLLAPETRAAATVPLEEAFIINDPQKRRTLMMNMLRSDPRKHLDLLLLARFNEDPETAHYATATLMELQRQIQLELQRLLAALERNPDDPEAREAYVIRLDEYVKSGLLEGRLLARQRAVLNEALKELIERAPRPEWLCMSIENRIRLGQAQEARAQAEEMLKRWPQEESSWLEMLRVCVETRDKAGLNALLAREGRAGVDWTRAGWERLRYFKERAA